MKHRFTIKQLEEWSDSRVLGMILSERLSDLHPYAPLAQRLKKISGKLNREERITRD